MFEVHFLRKKSIPCKLTLRRCLRDLAEGKDELVWIMSREALKRRFGLPYRKVGGEVIYDPQPWIGYGCGVCHEGITFRSIAEENEIKWRPITIDDVEKFLGHLNYCISACNRQGCKWKGNPEGIEKRFMIRAIVAWAEARGIHVPPAVKEHLGRGKP
mgnify:CR=1 FL=1